MTIKTKPNPRLGQNESFWSFLIILGNFDSFLGRLDLVILVKIG